MKFPQSRLFNVATASVVAFLGLGGGAAAAHTATVEAALLEASQAAREVQTKRDGLAQSLDRARLASGAANAHLSAEQVSNAVGELDTTVDAATAAAEIYSVVLEVPEAPFLTKTVDAPGVVADIETTEGQAEQATTGEATTAAAVATTEASADAEPSAAPTVTTSGATLDVASGTALEVSNVRQIDASLEARHAVDTTIEETVSEQVDTQVVADPEVQKVLDGEERNLEAVLQATAELERAAEALDEAALEVTRVADEVSVATEQAALEEAQDSLDGDVDGARAGLQEAKTVINAVGDDVADFAAVDAAQLARMELKAAVNEEVDREDVDALAAHATKVSDAEKLLDEALQDVRASHRKWVKAENKRIDAKNEKLKQEYEDAKKAAQAAVVANYRAAVAANQGGWSGQPAGVTGSNGRVVSSELCSLPFAPGHMLHCDAADALTRANAAYHAQTGRTLSLTDSYRSYASQVTTKARKGRLAAVPGTSNHGWGMAVDLDAASAAWLTANGADYGWVHPTWARSGGSKPEWWHLEFVAPGVADAQMPDEPTYLEHVTSSLPKSD
ncbi:M15 family metallopeptidase [Demequina salsinemoris]|uniref:M15 family metallopeptidase n=1 Tax=Demequina salsinemoris TaxID=577470 RepID=UPI000781B38E|nr:M15 family metallopeptidase [Demequina salsinemoris]